MKNRRNRERRRRDGPQTGVPKCVFVERACIGADGRGGIIRALRRAGLACGRLVYWCGGFGRGAGFCKAWAAAPDGTAVTGWYLLRVAAMLAAVAGTAAFSMEGALGAILPQLAQGPLLAAAMLWEERREHKKDERPH